MQSQTSVFPPTLRSVGVLAMLLGSGGIAFAILAVLITVAQSAAFANLQPDPTEDVVAISAFLDVLHAVHGLLLVHMPVWLSIGLVLLVAGNGARRGSQKAVARLRLGCWLAIIEIIAYLAHATISVVPRFASMFELARLNSGVIWIVGATGFLFAMLLTLPFVWMIRRASGSQFAGATRV